MVELAARQSWLSPNLVALGWLGLRVVGVAAGYYITAAIGTELSVPPSGLAIIWPGAAFLIAVLLVTPPREWWIYAIAVIPAHLDAVQRFQEPSLPLTMITIQVASNLALAFSTVLALRLASKKPTRFRSFADVLRFTLIAGIVVPAVVFALVLYLMNYQTGWTAESSLVWRQVMLASIFATITIPPLFVRSIDAINGTIVAPRRTQLETFLVSVILFALGFLVFDWKLGAEFWPALLLAPLPFTLWAAVRLGVCGTSLALLVFAAAIILLALDARGPFAAHSSPESVVALQVFLTAISIPQLLLAALIDERKQIEKQLRISEAQMQIAATSTDTGLWQWDSATQRLWMTENCRFMFGIDSVSSATPETFLRAVHVDDVDRVRTALQSTNNLQDMQEFRLVRPDGEIRWFIVRTHTDFDEELRPVRMSGVFRDVTSRITAEREAEQLGQRIVTLQEEERRSIAEELHDSTGQRLVAIALNLMTLRGRNDLTSQTSDLIEETLGSLSEASRELRTFTYLLHPPELRSESLCSVLQSYVGGFARRTGLTATLRASSSAERLNGDQQRAVLRIVQEGLTNIHRHAGASRVSVNLYGIAERLHLLIRDNGSGMKADREGQQEVTHLGVGIPGMVGRVRHLGGHLAIRSTSRGTIVHVVLPIAP